MTDPIGSGFDPLQGLRQTTTSAPTSAPASQPAPEKGFREYLLNSLEKVNQLQTEADAGVQKLLTGETDNVAEVFSTSRKAGVAFDLLMEIRNKLMDAYTEIRQMRV
ncbi:MAG: flagellar hook-basal body complex protein FliE [Phycisphaerales bacterium]|nr:flagellar hook-basal body complex protein FliE [Phycisphaerales bacterium]